MGGGGGRGCGKKAPNHFLPCNVGVSPQDYLTFSFNPFATVLTNFKAIPSASPKLLNLNHDGTSKKWFFWSSLYKIEVMITCLIKILELQNFGQMTTAII